MKYEILDGLKKLLDH